MMEMIIFMYHRTFFCNVLELLYKTKKENLSKKEENKIFQYTTMNPIFTFSQKAREKEIERMFIAARESSWIRIDWNFLFVIIGKDSVGIFSSGKISSENVNKFEFHHLFSLDSVEILWRKKKNFLMT